MVTIPGKPKYIPPIGFASYETLHASDDADGPVPVFVPEIFPIPPDAATDDAPNETIEES